MMKNSVIKEIGFVAIAIICFGYCGHFESIYTRQAEVIDVGEDGNFFAEDTTGNIWEFYASDLEVGEHIRLIMDDNHTINNIYDDVVKDIKKIDKK